MATLADIRKASSVNVITYTDDSTPEGTFIAQGVVRGDQNTAYLMVGEIDDENAAIAGRTELPADGSAGRHYTGSGISGGNWMLRGSLASLRSTHELMLR